MQNGEADEKRDASGDEKVVDVSQCKQSTENGGRESKEDFEGEEKSWTHG
jgi:hypothetical protein